MRARLACSFTGQLECAACYLDCRKSFSPGRVCDPICVHARTRGVYSVPAFGSEWYWWDLRGNIADPDAEARAVRAFHNRTYGFDYEYTSFAPRFTAELWDPDQWATLFKQAGIKYVVLTSKHHEGFCNWCSSEAFGWNGTPCIRSL